MPRVVELARLADHDRTRADDHDRRDIVAPRHSDRLQGVRPQERLEPFEEVARVVRSRPRLGVVLHREASLAREAHPLDDTVVQVDVRDGNALEGVRHHGVVVVLRRDLDAAGREVLDGVVAAVVAKGQLERRTAEGFGEELVAEADAKDRRRSRSAREARRPARRAPRGRPAPLERKTPSGWSAVRRRRSSLRARPSRENATRARSTIVDLMP